MIFSITNVERAFKSEKAAFLSDIHLSSMVWKDYALNARYQAAEGVEDVLHTA